MTPPRRRKPPGATTRNGWGHRHQQRRAAIAPIVNAGKATCARCHQPIHRGEEWHLDHDDTDRTTYLGPSHKRCNLVAGAHKTNGNGRKRDWSHLEQRVPSGIVACGICDKLIRKEMPWQMGHRGPEHVECEHPPRWPPNEARLRSVDW